MLKGDLSSTTIAEVLRQLADGDATGCLHVTDPAGEVAKTYLRGGRVYAVLAPGRRPQLGSRLVSSGALAPEALAEAFEAQRTELQGWRLGELLVHLGYVDQPVVQAFVEEQVRESLSDVLPWRSGAWKFRVNERTREDVAPPTAVDVLLEEITSRRSHWAAMEQTLHGPDSVPVLSTAGSSSDEMEIDPDAWSLLCKVDGARSITELARECGFTLYEAGQVVFTLVGAGLLEVEDGPVEHEVDLDVAEVEPLAPADVASRLVSALLAAPAQVPSQAWAPDEEQVTESRRVSTRTDDASVNSSISRVSEALASLLGPATADDDVFSGPTHRAAPTPAPALAPVVEDPRKAERARRAAARREADAEELATAQAELEAARAAEQERRDDLLPDGHVADVVDLHEVREAARLDEQARAEQQRLEEEAAAERLEAEAEAVAAQAEADRVEQERLAAEQQRLAAEQAEADRAAAEQAEQQRLAAEQAEAEHLATEEAARVAAEEAARVAAEQADADRLAAEEAAEQAEADRVAAEVAAEQAEAERVAAEVAAEQAEAERVAEEAVRVENERLAAERAEADRVAAEQQRLAAEQAEAERFAAEQAELERVAAEQAEAEQQRLAAEQAELERAAAEQAEAERVAAELAEQQRLAAEQAEAERFAAEQAELERVAAEQAEAERVAAEAESAQREIERLAAERAEAERVEQERAEQERVAAEADRLEQERLHAEAEAQRLAAAEQARLDEELALAARAEFAEAARLEQESAAAAKTRAEQAAAADFASYAAEFDEPNLPSYSADHAETQAAAFAELSASASMDVADTRPAATTVVADAPDPGPAPAKWDDEPVPFFSPGDTDTASLLRELSSLGLDDDPPSASPTRPARPPSTRPVAEAPKKRKGLFGRG